MSENPPAPPAPPAPPGAAAALASELPASPPAKDEMVDDAQTAAGGLRKTAQWIASALAAIPALGIVSSLIKGPGDAG